jgi:site-specific DNA recombinase
VSTDAQEKDGTSLDTQERACSEFARDNGWSIVESIREAASGYTLDRSGIARVRRLLQQGAADVVIAYAVDRLSRNQNHIGVLFDEVQQAGARLEFITEKFEDTAIGRFILAARAFIAEVEREKILERTTRGKLERARSGRIPQAMGKGCYGYVYNPGSGHRDIDSFQAEVVRRVFRRYAETRSFSVVSDELNAEGIPAFAGGRWYPLTVRRMLTNESYTGRLVYCRTRWISVPGGPQGKRRRRAVPRPEAEWIGIAGASPRIVDELLWQRVQEILRDPERIARRPTTRFYQMRGRLRCSLCRGAMVGQTITSKGRPYIYYVCRHSYDRRGKYHCPARNVRADALESGIWQEVQRVLSEPTVVLQELERQSHHAVDVEDMQRLQREVASIQERERRLVRLYTFGEIDEAVVREEGETLRRHRSQIEERLRPLQRSTIPTALSVDPEQLKLACAAVAEWLDRRDPEERVQVLEALQLTVQANRYQATLTGVLPTEPPGLAPGNNHAPAGRRQQVIVPVKSEVNR